MSFFNSIQQVDESQLEEQKDVVGGGGFKPLPSGIYQAVIKQAYGTQAKSGARGINLVLEIQSEEHGTREFRPNTFYVTNKEGSPTFTNKSGKQQYLPSYELINALTTAMLGTPLNQTATEEKTLPIYDFQQRKEVPTLVPVVTGLLDKKVAVCLVEVRDNKQEKNPSTGFYEPVNEERFYNDIDKFLFLKDGKAFTYLELKNQLAEPAFAQEWLDKNKDKQRNRFKDGKPAPFNGNGQASAPVTTQPLAIG